MTRTSHSALQKSHRNRRKSDTKEGKATRKKEEDKQKKTCFQQTLSRVNSIPYHPHNMNMVNGRAREVLLVTRGIAGICTVFGSKWKMHASNEVRE